MRVDIVIVLVPATRGLGIFVWEIKLILRRLLGLETEHHIFMNLKQHHNLKMTLVNGATGIQK
jgi:hypothetical protein